MPTAGSDKTPRQRREHHLPASSPSMQSFKLKGEKLIEKLRRRQSHSQPSSPTPGPDGQSSLLVPAAAVAGQHHVASPAGESAVSSNITVSSGILTPQTEPSAVAGEQSLPVAAEPSTEREDARQGQLLAATAAGSSASALGELPTPSSRKDSACRRSPQPTLQPAAAHSDDLLARTPSTHQRLSRNSRELNSGSPAALHVDVPTANNTKTPQRPIPARRQSLLPPNQTGLIRSLLETDYPPRPQILASPQSAAAYTPLESGASWHFDNQMAYRKIWVRRPGGSPTMVSVHEDDLVDDVRDAVLRKYTNALGRAYDAPDLSLRITPRAGVARPRSHSSHDSLHQINKNNSMVERYLQPDEQVVRTLDEYFPGGQTSSEALVIEVPRRQPRNSPNYGMASSAGEAHEGMDNDYFSIVAASGPHSSSSQHPPPLTSVPASPDARRIQRPPGRRMNTASPTVFQAQQNLDGQQRQKPIILRPKIRKQATDQDIIDTAAAESIITPALESHGISDPPLRLMNVPNKKPKSPIEKAAAVGLPNGAVPPINVLIVEDNIINLRLLEAFMKRLKVRWQSAMNGREAVEKWRTGGFHLVLMDIQLPVMSGLEATKEIRRLESVNGIGVLSGGPGDTSGDKEPEPLKDEDRLPSPEDLFKSPVIIVALTASSLQSDRNEALAAGCNDFLTKPVGFIFLEKKVTEWGCMQALIDFDGWRKWKEFPNTKDSGSMASGGGSTKTGSSGSTIMPARKNEQSSLGKQAINSRLSDEEDST